MEQARDFSIWVMGSAVLMTLVAAKGIAPKKLYFLPLGGSSIAETGIVLGFCFAATEVLRLLG